MLGAVGVGSLALRGKLVLAVKTLAGMSVKVKGFHDDAKLEAGLTSPQAIWKEAT